MREPKDTFSQYIDKKMGDELISTFSIDMIQEDWNLTAHELFFAFSCLNKYHIRFHPDFSWHIVLINKSKAVARAERKKDLSHR